MAETFPSGAGTALQVDTGNLFSAFTDSEGGFWAADSYFLGRNTLFIFFLTAKQSPHQLLPQALSLS